MESIVVRGKCGEQAVEIAALVADRATTSLCSATKLLSAGLWHRLETDSVSARCECHFRDLRARSPRDASDGEDTSNQCHRVVTLTREVESLKSEVRALRTRHTDCHGGEIAVDTLRKVPRHEVLNGHAECDNGCEVCVKTRGI